MPTDPSFGQMRGDPAAPPRLPWELLPAVPGDGSSTLASLRLARFRVTYRVLRRLRRPSFPGSVIRSCLGAALREIACLHPARRCPDCAERPTCLYGWLFDTGLSDGATRLRTHQDVPRPFVIEPAAEGGPESLPGETFSFDLVLFGRALDSLRDIVTALHEIRWLGPKTGASPGRNLALDHVRGLIAPGAARTAVPGGEDAGPQPVWDARHLTPPRPTWTTAREIFGGAASRTAGRAVESLEVEFLTPTRLKHEGENVRSPRFDLLALNILRRVSNIAYVHEGLDLDLDFRGLINHAREVTLEADETRWVDRRRYSRRQDAGMTLGGFVGKARYRGPLTPYISLLALGEYTHVGKNATLGFGRFRLAPPRPSGSPAPLTPSGPG